MIRLLACLSALILCTACSAPPPREGESWTVRAPMSLETGRPVVQMQLNGEGPYDVILDTGTTGDLLIDGALAADLNLTPRGETEISSPMGGAPARARVYRLDALSLDGFSARNVRTRALTGGDLMPPGADGVIGPAAFAGQVVEMDFRNNELRVGPRPSVTVDEADWLPLGASAPLLDAELRLARGRYPALIDTGNPGVLLLPDAAAARLPLKRRPAPIGEGRTVDRVFRLTAAPMNEEARLSGAVIPIRTAHFGPLPVSNLGAGGLRGTLLVIDWPNRRFALLGRAAPVQPLTDQ